MVDGARVRKAADGMLGLMGFLVVPDMAANSIQVNRSSKEGDTGLSLTQLGSGFTVDPSFPLYMEGFLGYSRVDPRFVFSDGQTQTRLPVRWNSVAASGGLGWDFPLTEHIVLRPIVSISLGHTESDVSLFARYLNLKYDVNLRFLKGGQLNNYGYGGALVLDYSLAREHYEVDIELRYSQMLLQTFASSAAVQGQSVPKTVGLWTRFRFPTSYEVFSRPLRTVVELSHWEFFGSEARDSRLRDYDEGRRRARGRCRPLRDRRPRPLCPARPDDGPRGLRAACPRRLGRHRRQLLTPGCGRHRAV